MENILGMNPKKVKSLGKEPMNLINIRRSFQFSGGLNLLETLVLELIRIEGGMAQHTRFSKQGGWVILE